MSITAKAQKLPSTQQGSLRTPPNIKVDGKAKEWSTFKAHNNATGISYTVSNDDNMLYFCGQAVNEEDINKIFGGGITLVIQKNGRKDDKDKVSVTYPVTTEKYPLIFNLKGRIESQKDTSAKNADSVMMRSNKLLQQKCKWIVVKGIGNLDTISIYNEDGIRAAGLFDIKKAYTFEIAIALSHLMLPVKEASSFSYHVIINGRPAEKFKINLVAGSTPEQIAAFERVSQSFSQAMANANASTDFWGEYTLAKKP